MILKLLLICTRYSLGSRILSAIGFAHQRIVGYRTEILIILEVATELCKVLKLLDPTTADSIKVALLGAIAPTLAEKIGRVQGQLESVIPKDSGDQHGTEKVR